MTIKKLVVGSILSMLLGSEMAAADWGVVPFEINSCFPLAPKIHLTY